MKKEEQVDENPVLVENEPADIGTSLHDEVKHETTESNQVDDREITSIQHDGSQKRHEESLVFNSELLISDDNQHSQMQKSNYGLKDLDRGHSQNDNIEIQVQQFELVSVDISDDPTHKSQSNALNLSDFKKDPKKNFITFHKDSIAEKSLDPLESNAPDWTVKSREEYGTNQFGFITGKDSFPQYHNQGGRLTDRRIQLKDIKLDLSTVDEGPSMFQNKLKDQISKKIVMHFQGHGQQKEDEESVALPSDFNSEKVHMDIEQSSENHSSNLETQEAEIDLEAEQGKDKEQIKAQYFQALERDRDIRIEKLREHIFTHHPVIYEDNLDDYDNYSMVQDINSLTGKFCCSRKYILRFNRSIGLGPSIFLLQLRAYMCLFLLISILSAPLSLILSSDGYVDTLPIGNGFLKSVAQRSLGNIGPQVSHGCGFVNFAESDKLNKGEHTIDLQCPHGKFRRLMSFGMQKQDGQDVCSQSSHFMQVGVFDQETKAQQFVIKSESELSADVATQVEQLQTNWQRKMIINNFVEFEAQCSSYLLDKYDLDQNSKQFLKEFDKSCKDSKICKLTIDYSQMSESCTTELQRRAAAADTSFLYDKIAADLQPGASQLPAYAKDNNVPEPLFYVIAECESGALTVNLFGSEISRDGILSAIIGMDFLLFTIFIIGFNFIHRMSKDFVTQFHESVVEVKDFTVQINKLPKSFSQYTDEIGLKRALYQQMQGALSECIKLNACPPDIDKSIVSIDIRHLDLSLLNEQKKMKEQIELMMEDHAAILNIEQSLKRFYKNDVQTRAKSRLTQNASKLQYLINKSKIIYSHQLGVEETEVDNEEVNHQKYLAKHKEVKEKAKAFFDGVQEIYITFGSAKTAEIIREQLKTYGSNKLLRFSSRKCCQYQSDDEEEHSANNFMNNGKGKQQSKLDNHGSLYLMENAQNKTYHYLQDFEDNEDDLVKVQEHTKEATDINWQARPISPGKSKLLNAGLLLLTNFMAFVQLYFAIQAFDIKIVKEHFSAMTYFVGQSYSCQGEYSIEVVASEIVKKRELQNHQMISCFCRSNAADRDRTRSLYFGKDIPNVCNEWLKHEDKFQAKAFGSSLFAFWIFLTFSIPVTQFIQAKLSGDASLNSKENSRLNLFATQFLVMTIVLMMVTETIYKEGPEDFGREFYNLASGTLMMAGLLMVAPFSLFQVGQYVYVGAKRKILCQVYKQKKSMLDAQEEKIATELTLQSKINELYTGPKFEGAYPLLQMHGIMMLSLIFGGVMPLFYPIAFMVLAFIYASNKYLILNFYQKFQNFDENLVLDSSKHLLIPIFLHMIMVALALHDSKMLRPHKHYSDDNLENQLTVEQLNDLLALQDKSTVSSYYTFQQGWYMAYFSFIVLFYIFNLFIINPATCCIQEGFLFTVQPRSKRKTSLKQVQKLGGPAQSPPDAISVSQSEASGGTSNYACDEECQTNHKHLRVKYQCDMSFWRRRDPKLKPRKWVMSENYYAEIDFRTLRVLLLDQVDQISTCIKRIDLYQRIVGINQGSKFGKIFEDRCKLYDAYMQQLIENKEKIEAVVKNYWKLIVVDVGDEQARDLFPEETLAEDDQESEQQRPKIDLRKLIEHQHDKQVSGQASQGEQGDRSPSNVSSPSIGKQKKKTLVKDLQSSVHADNDHSVLSHKVSFRLNQVDLDRKATHDINMIINKLHRENTQRIIVEERVQEKVIRESIASSLVKLDYLSNNYQEQWLKLMFPDQLTQNLRCHSQIQSYNIHCSQVYQGLAPSDHIMEKAELLLRDPYLQDHLKILREQHEQQSKNESPSRGYVGASSAPRDASPVVVLDNEDNDDEEIRGAAEKRDGQQKRGRLNDLFNREETEEQSKRSLQKMNTQIDTSNSFRLHNETSRMIIKD